MGDNVQEKITTTPVITLGDWTLYEAKKEVANKRDSFRWIARRHRKLPTIFHKSQQVFWVTEAMATPEMEYLSVYSYRGLLESQERISGLLNPDPIPFEVIATLLGMRATSMNQKHIITPDDPEFGIPQGG